MRSGRRETIAALVLVAPFVVAYLVLFIYPTVKMAELSFTDAPLIGDGQWVGWSNYIKLAKDNLFIQAAWHTGYFVLLTVIPTTLIGLVIAMMVTRLSGWLQSMVLACFFLPYILPVTVVYLIWTWMLDIQFGIAQYVIAFFHGDRVPVFRDRYWAMPAVAFITIWWTNGFNVLLFIAGLRNISQDLYDSASLDGAGRWQQFRYITWPLIWPITALVLTIQLILQLKIFDQIYLFTQGGPFNSTYVMVQYIYKHAFQLNHGGYAATVAVALFLVIVVLSVMQYQVLRVRGARS
jgi:multiple sugar transport system permease protein